MKKTATIAQPTSCLLVCLTLILTQVWGTPLHAEVGKLRCMWQDAPATTMVVAWVQENGDDPKLYLDTIAHEDADSYAQSFSPHLEHRFKQMNHKFVRLEGLRPNTVYHFIIKDSGGQSRAYSFRTLPDDRRPLSIIAGGDSRNHRHHRQNANRLVAKLRPHLVMFGGDMTGSDGSGAWKRWLDDWQLSIGEDGRITPIVVARGNHERSNEVIWRIFDVPNEDIYYAFTIGGQLLRIYTLNSMIAPGGKQRDWLQDDLSQQSEARWKMAQYHHPIRPHTSHKSEKLSQQEYWAPLFYEYGMDLVVECDAHVAKTTYPIRPSREEGSEEGFIRDDARGTVYVGEGCWGAPLRRNNDNKSWTRASGSFNQFKWIFVDANHIEIRTVKTDHPEKVVALADSNRFQIPELLDIWQPPSGEVVFIGEAAPSHGNNDDAAPTGNYAKEAARYSASLASATTQGGDPSTRNKILVAVFFLFFVVVVAYPWLAGRGAGKNKGHF